jgi:hypothetical protein
VCYSNGGVISSCFGGAVTYVKPCCLATRAFRCVTY